MTDIISALYYACCSEEPDTVKGPSLCDYYRRTVRVQSARRALPEESDAAEEYGAAMEEQGFINGFRYCLALLEASYG